MGLVVVMSLLWWVGPHMGQHDGACVPASLLGGDCPNVSTDFAASFHAGVIRQFTQVVVISGQPAFLIALLVLALFGFALIAGRQFIPFQVSVVSASSRQHWRVPKQLRLTHWFALLEHSPSLNS